MSRLPGSIDQRKRDAVLDAAAALIVTRGPGISLGEIARRSQVSKQTIYNYFGDKPGLFQALLESRAGPSECPLCLAATDAAPAAFLAAYAKRLLDWLGHVRLAASLQALIAPEHARSGQVDLTAGSAVATRARATLARILDDQARRGRMRIDDPAHAAELFFDLIMAGRTCGLAQAELDAGPAADIETAAEACGRIFARAYAADPDDCESRLSANPILLAVGPTPIGSPIPLRKEASR
jgi:TetR/AcrR family transcriptional repressor of mexJK operon